MALPEGTPVGLLMGQTINPPTVQNSDGQITTFGMGHAGEQIVRELGGKRYIAASRGNLFHACYGAVTLNVYTTTAGVALLFNPLGSGKLVEVHKIRATPILATEVVDGLVLGVLLGVGGGTAVPTTHSAAAGIYSMPLNGSSLTPVASAWASATVVQPSLLMGLGMGDSSTTATNNMAAPAEIDFDGTLVLAPGTIITVATSTTVEGGANLIIDIDWSEWNI